MTTEQTKKRYASQWNREQQKRIGTEGNLTVYASRINSLSCLFYIDLKSFFEGGNYHKKAMNFLSLMLEQILPSRRRTSFSRKCEKSIANRTIFAGTLCVDKFNDRTASINHQNRTMMPCALRCASIIERTIVFPFPGTGVVVPYQCI